MGTHTNFADTNYATSAPAAGKAPGEIGCLSPLFGFGSWNRRNFLRTAALLALSTCVARAGAAADALTAISNAAAALVNDDAQGFFDSFDRDMPNYAALRANVEGLLSASAVGATVDVVTNEGDETKRTLSLDWVLALSGKNTNTGGKETRRGVVRCEIERRGRSWKVTSIEPVDFFKP
ncbi:MAG: hypothetical protein ABL995_12910 [Bryobacteraceae bacterium]